MKKARRSFDQQFKIVAVRALAESGKTTGEFARALGIGRSQLERWKKRLEGRPRLLTTFPAKDGVGAEQHELAELRRDRERLRAVLAELLAAVTSKGAPDTTEPICWSGSAYQNRRIYAAIDAARGAGRKEHGHE